jgi:hypothetical protein
MAKAKPQKNCANCRFWQEPDKGGELNINTVNGVQLKGTCKFFPADIDKDGDDWCGQWKTFGAR